MTQNRSQQISQFLAQHGHGESQLFPLAGDASFRRYIRILAKDKTHYMLMDAPPEKENIRPYVAAADYLCRQGFSAPRIIAGDATQGFLLLEDLGDDSFTRLLAAQPQREEELYRAAVDVLAAWRSHAAKNGFYDVSEMSLRAYDSSLLLEEVKLFADWYLPQVLGAAKAAELRVEYLTLWHDILTHAADLARDQWVHRDFHADNLMWLPQRQGAARVGLLDFQDGVIGDAAYDLVSLLEDARRDVPPALASQMIDYYLSQTGMAPEMFYANYALLGAQRNSKIIGIFARLAVRDGKPNYLNFLPRVWAHLERDLSHPLLASLKQWLDRHVSAMHRGIIAINATSPSKIA